MFSWVCTLLGFSMLWSAGTKASDVAYVRQPFVLKDQEPTYDLHVVRPLMPGDAVSPEGRRWLERLARFVRTDAEARGYLNERTTPHYDWELEQLASGEWPAAFVTGRDEDDVLAMVSYAIRRDAFERLPFQRRFPSQGSQWPGLGHSLRAAVGASDPRSWVRFPELGLPANRASLDGMLTLRPWLMGDVAEVKFLTLREPAHLPLVQMLVEATIDHELARFGRIPMSASQHAYVREEGMALVGAELRRLLPRLRFEFADVMPDPEMKELSEAVAAYFREQFLSEQWQPFARVSQLYVHVSGEDRGRALSARSQMFIRTFGFPAEPEYSFLETAEEGTSGIRTQIFRLSVGQFERGVQAALEERTGLPMARTHYVPTSAPCVVLLSTIEADLVRHVSRVR